MKSITSFISEALNEANETIKSEKDFREAARAKFEEVFGDDLDEDQMNETIDGLLDDNKDLVENGEWGELIGMLNKSFASDKTNEDLMNEARFFKNRKFDKTTYNMGTLTWYFTRDDKFKSKYDVANGTIRQQYPGEAGPGRIMSYWSVDPDGDIRFGTDNQCIKSGRRIEYELSKNGDDMADLLMNLENGDSLIIQTTKGTTNGKAEIVDA